MFGFNSQPRSIRSDRREGQAKSAAGRCPRPMCVESLEGRSMFSAAPIHLPAVQLPAVQLPAVQLPAVQAPIHSIIVVGGVGR